eukprot:TRINITY_DN21852_c0_g1_i1.p1 TRINITY_DN21852_c0_g1~~TRINITY_DN21852_c0_g1_i1.p1  ORF type:complete len:315 (-),score=27.78 TRINITY_DN21852_c0_g1_i1:62-1006(-)
MLLQVGCELTYHFPEPTPLFMMLNVSYTRMSDLQGPDHITTTPDVPMEGFRDGFGNWCQRILAPAGLFTIGTNAFVRDSGLPDYIALDATQCLVKDLPVETLVFLLGSRYCETDLLVDFAWKQFGSTPLGWDRVSAICKWVHAHMKFDYTKARATRSAQQAFEERVGVCRDFAHLALTLCRCMNIPARYCTGFLGDIGVPADSAPMDFSAWFEVFLIEGPTHRGSFGGRWFVFDARHYGTARVGRVLIARGRDAADVPISNSFGANALLSFRVWTHEVDGLGNEKGIGTMEGSSEQPGAPSWPPCPPRKRALSR